MVQLGKHRQRVLPARLLAHDIAAVHTYPPLSAGQRIRLLAQMKGSSNWRTCVSNCRPLWLYQLVHRFKRHKQLLLPDRLHFKPHPRQRHRCKSPKPPSTRRLPHHRLSVLKQHLHKIIRYNKWQQHPEQSMSALLPVWGAHHLV